MTGFRVGRAPVGHDNGGFSRQEVRPLRLDGLADQSRLRVDVAPVNQDLQELKSGAHIVAVFGLAAVEGRDFRLRVPAVVQVSVGLGENERLQPPAVCPDGRLESVFLENAAALQELLRCFRLG